MAAGSGGRRGYSSPARVRTVIGGTTTVASGQSFMEVGVVTSVVVRAANKLGQRGGAAAADPDLFEQGAASEDPAVGCPWGVGVLRAEGPGEGEGGRELDGSEVAAAPERTSVDDGGAVWDGDVLEPLALGKGRLPDRLQVACRPPQINDA